ncbi:hypothetical protein OIU34_17325 [Pararhizobium sp. BT-229]|uniref:hypothetical protein n=1 Tax=Pararhizobium sp. BT-229 TaxID=2986923 RepID=UPI0021F6C11B|nr:hypothetical protein [Pararhizobium sp. BT-229]MCV9963664.1 hypothetical protein [Pararhizobium sp. BT-229]
MFYDHNKTTIGNLITELTHDATVQKLLAYSLGRVLLNEAKAIHGVLDLDVLPEYEHIRDWLLATVKNGEKWLESVDAHGRPKKLMKFGSIDAIVREADKAMMKFAQKSRQVRIADGDEQVAHELSDGWYVVRLLTPTALDRESGEMQHCIGQGGYDDKLNDPAYAYYSLRDPFGKAHATMEVSVPKGVPLQMQGKQNDEPIPEYFDRMLEFMKTVGIVPVQLTPESRWVFDEDHKRHDIENLPDGVTLVGSVSVMLKKMSFPKRVAVRGDLKITASDIACMPEELHVGGEYRVGNSQLRTTPRFLKVGGDIGISASRCEVAETVDAGGKLFVAKSHVSRLPCGLVAKNRVLLDQCDELTNLENLTSLDHLFLTRMPPNIRLPDGLQLGSLEIVETEFSTYPSNVTVKRDVDLYKTGLEKLPDGLVVHGCLDVSGNPLGELPEGLRVGDHLTFSKTQVSRLPEDFAVGGSIIASDTPLTSLGKLREVNGRLEISRTQIEELPDGLHVRMDLDAVESRLKTIGSGVRVGKTLYITKTDVTELPADIVVEEGLDASYSSLRSLPDGFETQGEIRLEGSDLRALPEGFHAWGNLNISHTPITEFPAGVVIDGDLKCTGTRLRKLAEDTVVNGDVEHPLGNSIFLRPMERMMLNMARNARKQVSP